MTRADIIGFIREEYGERDEYPFTDDLETAVFRHSGNRKWFAIIMTVPKSRLGIAGEGKLDIINLKCDPDIIFSMLGEAGIYPAYHMNKQHWLSVALDGDGVLGADAETLKWLIEVSHSLTRTKMKKLGR